MTNSNAETLEKAKLRDLESLLRKKFSENLEVIDYVTESLLPVGENYGSSILKVDATIKKNCNEKEENLDLVAKMIPPTEIQRMIFDSPSTFRKEAFLYEELIPAYKRLESEFGVRDEEVFDIVPQFYGARYSLKSDDEFDEDAVILMQNLKVLGYYTGDRKLGLDLEHSKVAVTALARFHALGIAMRQHKPHYFETIKGLAKHNATKNSEFDKRQEYYLKLMLDDPEISIHHERLKAAMSQGFAAVWKPSPPDHWSTIIHSDFWVNNVMFRKSSDQVLDIKFVDFQVYLNSTPQRELTFFLMTSLNIDVMSNHFDEIIHTYYNAFVKVLERMKCDTEPFSRHKFDEQMKIDAFMEFPHCPIILKVMSADVATDMSIDQIEDIFLLGAVTPLFRERLRRCVKKYAEKGWFDI